MNILYTLDNNFVSQVAASICSVCENNSHEQIHFFLFSKGILDENKAKLKEFIENYRQTVSIFEIGDLNQYFDFEFDTSGWNPIVLARLLCEKILPKSVEKILYLDGDTIVLRSLSDLWTTDMKGSAIGGCIEPTIDKDRKKSLDMEFIPYINAGVLLIDLNVVRKEHTFEHIIDYYRENDGKLFANDQDAINGCLKDKIFLLPPKYNYANTFSFYPYSTLCKIAKPSNFVDKNVYLESMKNPTIIHYLGEERPWRVGNKHAFKDDYVRYATMTPWGDVKEYGWETYFKFWNLFNFFMKPFPTFRYKIINSLIPCFMKYRAKQRKKVENNGK